MKIDKLSELFNSDIQYFYFAKKKTEQILPRLEGSVNSEELGKIIKEYSASNSKHIERLKEAFNKLGLESNVKESKGIEGIIEEVEELADKKSIMDQNVFDAAMIATIQRILHYNISASGTLRTYSSLLGKREISTDLNNILIDEKETDSELTEFAEKHTNLEAAEAV